MKTKCLIVDDEPLAIELVQQHVEQVDRLELIGTCQNALEAFEVLKQHKVDLIFLDIQMPMLTGIEFLKSLQNPPKVIFTTAYREYAVEGYELDIVDYLLKPISFNRFFKAINKYFALVEPAPSATPPPLPDPVADFIYLKSNKRTYKVSMNDILYVESLKDYVKVHLPDSRIVTKDKISDFEQRLPSHFLRVHRSFIVNMRKITAFSSNDIEINGVEVPIGISYKEQVMDHLPG
jgi:DNA-binding LytR/AlgR family response regulator